MSKISDEKKRKSDDDEIQDINGVSIYLNKLMKNVDEAMLDDIKIRFQQYKNGKVNEKELLDILESYHIILPDETIKPMFVKIDVRKNGLVSFLDFATYLAYEFRTVQMHKISAGNGLQQLMPKLLSKEAIKYDKKVPSEITAIEFIPYDNQQSQTLYANGAYMLVDELGGVQFYTSDMKWIRTHEIYELTSAAAVASITASCVVVLPDFKVVCVSTANQLRFYDTDPNAFRLRLTVDGVLNVTCLAYAYGARTVTRCSRLAAGTGIGDVLVLELPSITKKNPFYSEAEQPDRPPPAYDVWEMSVDAYGRKSRGAAGRPPFRAVWFIDLHPDTVLEVAFCDAGGRRFASVSDTNARSVAYCRVDQQPKGRNREQRLGVLHAHDAPGGARCACAVGYGRVATGDRHGRLTLWAVEETRVRLVAKLDGRSREAMRRVFYDQVVTRLYSVSSDLTVTVWDATKAVLLGTVDVWAKLADDWPGLSWRQPPSVVAHFDQAAVVLAIAVGDALVTYKCDEYYDGSPSERVISSHSHSTPVVKTMYNALFRVLVSVSAADSTIVVWNPCTGSAIVQRSMAHQRTLYGIAVPVEITAAAFDPSLGLVVTGAANGTVKVWNISDLTQLNGLTIPSRERITEIVWMPNQLLVTGRDRRVTEIPETFELLNMMTWRTAHDADVLSMCANLRSTMLVTTTRAGEIGFWNLPSRNQKTQHVVRRCAEPTDRDTTAAKGCNVDGGHCCAVVASRFLLTRPEAVGVGKLLVAIDDGAVQLWCTYALPVQVARFVATHVHGDHVTCMSTDARNQYLFTGFDSGYVKTWYVADFGNQRSTTAVTSKHSLRLRFPFLTHSLFIGRAERAAARNTTGPTLVNSYRAHAHSVTHIEYADGLELLVTSSVDRTIRVWTLAGHFIGVLGTPWPRFPKTGPVHLMKYSFPPNIMRETSYTTMKILRSGENSEDQITVFWNEILQLNEQRRMHGKTTKLQLQHDDNTIVRLLNYDSDEHSEVDQQGLQDLQDLQNQRQLKLILSLPHTSIHAFKYLTISDLAKTEDLLSFQNNSDSNTVPYKTIKFEN